ncbi:MAG: hypothetical protein C5S47_02815 [Candidatus Methanogasteraceae archaeon]|nr:MAG: hypothetical protein C5S47_02815 [ANME-2 cluster archaeon]
MRPWNVVNHRKKTSSVIPMAMPKPIPRTSALQIAVPTALLRAVAARPNLRWDVSGDGSVTSLDALMILQAAAGSTARFEDRFGRINSIDYE